MERVTDWRRTSFSPPHGNCVEWARADDGSVFVRQSNTPDSPVLVFGRAEWDAFIKGVQAGELG